MKILVVDDSKISQMMFKRFLTQEGYEVTTCGGAIEAVELYKENDFSIIITDIMMPEIDGFELCRRIRSLPNSDYIVILATTSFETPELLEKILNAGADDYLAKPNLSKDNEKRVFQVRLKIAENMALNRLERKLAEEETKRSEFRFSTILKTTNEGFIEVDNNEIVIAVNPAMCNMLGYSKEEMIGSSFYDFIDENALLTFKIQLKLREKGKTGVYELKLKPKDKSDLYCLFNASPIMDDNGNKVGSFAMVNDITFRKNAEEALQKMNQNLEMLVQQRTKELSKTNKALTEKNEIMKKELQVARRVQQWLIPKVFPEEDFMEISAKYAPMDELGGDFYDVFKLDDTKIVLLIADVCGHGVAAALITALAKVIFAEKSGQKSSPGEIVKQVNSELYKIIGNQEYLTAFYCIIDLKSGRLEYTNAAHNDIFLFKKDKPIKALKVNSPFIGIANDVEFFTTEEIMEPGDRLVLYTDGIIELRNKKGELFGDNRLKRIISKYFDLPPKELINKIFMEIENFKFNPKASDDMALLISDFKRNGKSGKMDMELFMKKK